MVSHELRVPLTSIKGAITTLLASSTALDPVEMHQFYRIIDHQAERMRDLISDLLGRGTNRDRLALDHAGTDGRDQPRRRGEKHISE